MSPVVAAAAGYGVGSIPFSFLVARAFGVRDVRTVGSGNVGATNVMRSAGRIPGAIALVLDALKGAAAVWILDRGGAPLDVACLGGFAAVVGHLFPVWLGFRGGKGVATGAGLFIPLAPLALLASVALFATLLAATRVVSVASIVASLSLGPIAGLLGAPRAVVVLAVAAALLIVAKHHENIARLRRGEEPRLGGRSS
jgi:glycerol-3-phosphate acyltransferase PlsY